MAAGIGRLAPAAGMKSYSDCWAAAGTALDFDRPPAAGTAVRRPVHQPAVEKEHCWWNCLPAGTVQGWAAGTEHCSDCCWEVVATGTARCFDWISEVAAAAAVVAETAVATAVRHTACCPGNLRPAGTERLRAAVAAETEQYSDCLKAVSAVVGTAHQKSSPPTATVVAVVAAETVGQQLAFAVGTEHRRHNSLAAAGSTGWRMSPEFADAAWSCWLDFDFVAAAVAAPLHQKEPGRPGNISS